MNKIKLLLLNNYYIILRFFAKIYLKKHKPFVIWNTWSVWKTSSRIVVTEVIKNLLKDKTIYTSPKNFNWEFWMILSIFCIEKSSPTVLSLLSILFEIIYKSLFWKKLYDIVFLEYWIDHPWEMDFLLSIVKPNISFLTKIDKVHSLQFSSPDIIAKEKFKLIYNTKETVFLNIDDSYSLSAIPKIDIDLFIFSSSWEFDEKCSIKYENYEVVNKWLLRTKFDLTINDNKKLFIDTNLVWKENLSYIWIWVIVADILYYKIKEDSIFNIFDSNLILDINLLPWRNSFFRWIENSIILDSSYNSSPESLKLMINNVLNLRNSYFTNYKLILCLWEMRELWEFSEQEHRKIAWYISQSADQVLLIWESMVKYTYDELIKIWADLNSIKLYDSSIKLWVYLREFLIDSSFKYLILFKWSQNTIFLEEWIKGILLDKNDEEKLCRQQDRWLKKKKEYFDSIHWN